jgi:single-strand DNA-binding protein
MANSVNKVILVGNLGKDPEVRTLESGSKVVGFSLATSEKYKDKITGEQRVQTDWHNIVMWRNLADIADKYLRKGMQVYIEGKLRTRSWQDRDGNNRYTTEVVADNMVMMSKSNNDSSSHSGSPDNHSNAPGENDMPNDLPF